MVNAQTWLDQNYPQEQRKTTRELDLSNKNLEGPLNLTDFVNLYKLNISFNNLTHFYPSGKNDIVNLIYENNIIEEIDCSYNNFNTNWGIWKTDAMKKLNFSNNKVISSTLIARNLAYLDAGNNNLDKLNLSQASQGLVELKCSGNHLADGLDLTDAPKLIFLDCLGTKLITPVSSSPTSAISSTTAVYVNNPALTFGLGVSLGISTLGWVILGFIFCHKRFLWKTVIPTSGS